MKLKNKRLAMAVAATLTALTVSACGSSDNGAPAAQHLSDRGPITFVQGKDNTGDVQNIVAEWNKLHPDQKVTLKELSDSSDQQHDDLVQHFKAQDSGYDVVATDVVWTAEFAAQGWLQPLEGSTSIDTTPLLSVAVDAATYQGKLYVAPYESNGGMLFYRKDLVPNPPKTWNDLLADCAVAKAHNIGCYAGQFAQYEGLTVNVTEAINAAGGEVVKADGKTPDVDTPQAAAGLSFLVNAYKNGDIPQQAITYQEEDGRQAFEAGQLMFLRNWPYVYNLATNDGSSVVKDKFGVAPLPGPNGVGASTLGGYNLGISVYSQHKATALDFIKFIESDPIQREILIKQANPPVLKALYSDPALVSNPALGFLPVLGESLADAKSRPVTPYYPAVTKAIQDNAYAALKGDKTVDQALKDMQAAIGSASSS